MNIDALSYSSHSVVDILVTTEEEKKWKYMDQLLDLPMFSSHAPFVVSELRCGFI